MRQLKLLFKEESQREYISRINRVIDYIEKNLDTDLSLDTLAKVACFSSFHFHRIFSSIVGETLNRFIIRVRLEKTAGKLKTSSDSITDIAYLCGFSSSASFARAFRDYFKMSPSQWRKNREIEYRESLSRNEEITERFSNICKDFVMSSMYIDKVSFNQTWNIELNPTGSIKMLNQKNIKIEVKELPEMKVAYVRSIGSYKGNSELFRRLFEQVFSWSGSNGLLGKDTKAISIYHDDPDLTEEDKLRVSVCVTVPKKTEPEGEIGRMTVSGGKFAVGRFEIATDQFEEAWQIMMSGWLPQSGYQCDDRHCYEVCLNDYRKHPENKHIVDICVPVKPL